MELTLVPAYGRDYSTEEAALAAWRAGKDFMIETAVSPDCGRYCSIRDKLPGGHVRIRYCGRTEVVRVPL